MKSVILTLAAVSFISFIALLLLCLDRDPVALPIQSPVVDSASSTTRHAPLADGPTPEPRAADTTSTMRATRPAPAPAARAHHDAEPSGTQATPSVASTGWSIRGVCRKVIDPERGTREPLPGAQITVWQARAYVGDRRRVATVIADDEGRFDVSLDMLRDLSLVHRSNPGIFLRGRSGQWFARLAPHDLGVTLPVENGRSSVTTVELDFVRSGAISGRVVDEAGRPVSDLSIDVTHEPDPPLNPGWPLDSVDGTFTTTCRYCGRLWVHLYSDRAGEAEPIRIELPDFGHVDLGVVMVRHVGGVIGGVAVYADGTPATMLEMNVSSPDAGGSIFPVGVVAGYSGTVRTDRAGRFLVRGLKPARYTVSSVEDDAYPQFDVKLGTRDVRYVVPKPRLIARVRDDRGRPASAIELQIMGWRGTHADEARRWWPGGRPLHELEDVAIRYESLELESDGIFGLGVETGDFWVIALHHTGIEGVTKRVDIPLSVNETIVDLTARRATRVGHVTVNLSATEGPPPVNFSVNAQCAFTRADVSGLWTSDYASGQPIPPLAVGRYEITIYPGGRFFPVKRTIMINPGPSTLDVCARPGSLLTVRVAVAPRERYEALRESIRVRIIDVNTDRVVATLHGFYSNWELRELADANKRYGRLYRPSLETDLYRPGRYRLVATADGVATVEKPITLERREAHTVTLLLE